MSKQIVEAIAKIVGDKNPQADVVVERYRMRPAARRTRGYNAAPPNNQYAIASPLTEVGRVTQNVTITDNTGVYSVTVAVATQITFEDANGSTVVMNFAAP